MYKILKDSGLHSLVAIENTETKAQLTIGRISIQMLKILEEAGYKTEDSTLNPNDRWDLEISEETKDTLAKIAHNMNKPVIHQVKKSTPLEKPEDGQPVDVFNLIFGIK